MRYSLMCFTLLVCGVSVGHVYAGELRYTPLNPSFGGPSFNSSHLLSTADSQNDNEESIESSDPLESLSQTVTSSLLNRIAFEVSDAIFGEEAQNSGKFLSGSTVIEFERVGDNVVVDITDGLTGNQTTITVPVPVL